jgi:hypothetical protein
MIEDTVTDERKGAMFSMFEQMDALHPLEAHWHLPLIGVDPAHSGKGNRLSSVESHSAATV